MPGEHTLLVGNQGVGKNKIVDHLLERLEYPREYMQLHRDTTGLVGVTTSTQPAPAFHLLYFC